MPAKTATPAEAPEPVDADGREMPTNVIAAIARAAAEMGGVAKTEPKQRDDGSGAIKFAYRSIGAITAAAQPLLGKYGVVIHPLDAIVDRIEPITIGQKPWTDIWVTTHFAIYGPGGVDDVIYSTMQGMGRDNSDKGYNKACTMAFKNLLLRILCIGDPKDDADAEENQNLAADAAETGADRAAREAAEIKTGETDALLVRLRAMPDEVKSAMVTYANGRSLGGNELWHHDDWRASVTAKLDALTSAEPAQEPQLDLDVAAEPVVHGPLADAIAAVDPSDATPAGDVAGDAPDDGRS